MATNDMRSVDSDIRILLVGRTGHGKSSTANSIFGSEKFKISSGAKSETCTSQWSKVSKRFGKTIEVVDTPGLFDTHKTEREIHKELIRSLLLTTPGFHAIAFVLEKGRFTDELIKTKDLFFDWFGRGVEKYSCIILTKTEDEKSLEKYISTDTTEGLDDLIKKCGGKLRIAPIENTSPIIERKEEQVKRILDMVEEIKNANSNTHFTNAVLQLATVYITKWSSKVTAKYAIEYFKDVGERITTTQLAIMLEFIDDNDVTYHIPPGSDSAEEEQPINRRRGRMLECGGIPNDEETVCLYQFKEDYSSGRRDESGFFFFFRRLLNDTRTHCRCIIL